MFLTSSSPRCIPRCATAASRLSPRSGNDDAPMDVDDDDNDTDTDDFDDDDEHDSGSLDDHELKMARQADAEMGSSKSKKKRTVRIVPVHASRAGIDASTVMLTGDPVRMYLKEIGKVDLLTASEEVDWP